MTVLPGLLYAYLGLVFPPRWPNTKLVQFDFRRQLMIYVQRRYVVLNIQSGSVLRIPGPHSVGNGAEARVFCSMCRDFTKVLAFKGYK